MQTQPNKLDADLSLYPYDGKWIQLSDKCFASQPTTTGKIFYINFWCLIGFRFGYFVWFWFKKLVHILFWFRIGFINTRNPNIGSPSILVPFNISNFSKSKSKPKKRTCDFCDSRFMIWDLSRDFWMTMVKYDFCVWAKFILRLIQL